MKDICFKTSAFVCIAFIATGCTVAKLEARLEANPQCKDVVNPKTGALMPCPGSDKAFYRELGLIPAKTATPVTNGSDSLSSTAPESVSVATATQTPSMTKSTPIDCKPQIHKKTGGTMPCPAPE